MEIVYFWLEEYKNLKNISVNLGSEFIFDLDAEFLNVRKNELYINSFFDDSKTNDKGLVVKNVTGIVGENGTGKSTLLEFILEFLCYKESLSFNFLVIYKYKDNFFYDFRFENGFKLKFNYLIDEFPQIKRKNINSFKKKVILFSNIFDARAAQKKIEDKYENLLDISTNYLNSNWKTESNLRYLNEEFTRQIVFVKKFMDKLNLKEFVNIPDYVCIEIKPLNINKIVNVNEYNFRDVLEFFIDEGIPVLLEKIKKQTFMYSFYENVIVSALIDLIDFIKSINNSLYQPFVEVIRNATYHISESPEDSSPINFLGDIYQYIEEELILLNKNKMPINEYLKEIKRRIDLRIDMLEKINLIDYVDMTEFTLKLKTESENFTAFLDAYNEVTELNSFIDFTWTELSSGEYALLSIFGRFYDIKDQLSNQNIILIDEGDLYFHPQWQKDFLYYLLRVLNIIYSDRSIQIIITTHSPFVLSDLPSYNVVFLEKSKNNGGNSIVSSGLEEGQLTFAANIHSLFTHSFFIRDGLCGLFAKTKINNLVDDLLSFPLEKIRGDEIRIRNTIDIIGEPIVKRKLLNLYEEKTRLDLLSIDKKILNLQKQINDLKELRNND